MVHLAAITGQWQTNFESWDAFANWLNNSNFAGLLLGTVLGFIGGRFLYLANRELHRETRAHALRLHEETRRQFNSAVRAARTPNTPRRQGR